MLAFGRFLLQSPVRAAIVLSVLTALSFFASPLAFFLVGTPLALIALRKGVASGIVAALGCVALTTLLGLAMNAALGTKVYALVPLVFLCMIWLPLWSCAYALRLSESQGMALLFVGVMGALFAGYVHFLLDYIHAWWALWFEQVKEGLAPDLAPAQLAQLESMQEAIVPMISTLMVSGYVINLAVALLLARWWQSALFNPGGFKVEFLTLRLPEKLLAPTLLSLIALLLLRGGAPLFFRDLVATVLILYLFQGLATIHRHAHYRKVPKIGLTVLYILLILFPLEVSLIVAGTGIANACLGKKPAPSG